MHWATSPCVLVLVWNSIVNAADPATTSKSPGYAIDCDLPAFDHGRCIHEPQSSKWMCQCDTGYKIAGSAEIFCQPSGIWDPPVLPACILDNTTPKEKYSGFDSATCKKPVLVNGDIKYSVDIRYIAGSRITVACDDHYAIKVNDKLVRELVLICSQDGNWVTNDGWRVNPECSVGLCGSPPEVPNSRVGFSSSDMPLSDVNQLVAGQSVFYQCEPGYTLVDSQANHLLCYKGEWRGSPPSCILIQSCDKPKSISDGRYVVTNSGYANPYRLGTQVEYKCNKPYQIMGAATIVCQEGHKWSHAPPQCIADSDTSEYCPSVSTMQNGHCFCESKSDLKYCEPFYMGLHVECVCDEGYKLLGESIITCGQTGKWDYMMPSCIQEMEIDGNAMDSASSSKQSHMSTLAIVVATACSVLGVLLLVMVIMVFRRRKPHPPRLCRPSSVPPPYSRVNSSSMDEHDRMLLIGYDNAQVALPTYDEATRSSGHHGGHFPHRGAGIHGQSVGEYRQLPSIPNTMRPGQLPSGETTSRHSIITTSTMNRDGISEVFGSIDTVNVSMSDASTAVTVETFDSASSHHSNMSRHATAGSINSSNGSLVTEDQPLLEGNQRDDDIESISHQGDILDKPEN